MRNEKEALGLYLTGHPFDAVRADAMSFVEGNLNDLISEPAPQTNKGERNYAQKGREVTVAGLVADLRKRGNRVSIVLDDDTARMEVSLFSEAFQEFRHLLQKDEIVVSAAPLRYDDFMSSWTVNAKKVLHIDRVIESRAKSMVLNLGTERAGPGSYSSNCMMCCCRIVRAVVMFRCNILGDTASARLEPGTGVGGASEP